MLWLLALLALLVGCGGERSVSVPVKPMVVAAPPPEITAFSVGSLPAAVIDQQANSIVISTQEWIEGLSALTATFTAVGTVRVGGVTQVSGSTANDFHTDLAYTVISGAAARTYTVQIRSPQTTGLPVIKIDTLDGQEITSKEDYVYTNVALIDSDEPAYEFTHTSYTDQIRGRGNSTWSYPKKPYRLKFDKKISLFGLTAAKSWVLLANYQDPTLMMNSIAFELGRRFGFAFTPHDNPVELFLNGQYQGSYVLTEQIQVGEGRVDIDADNGFLVELDAYYDEDPKFTTDIYELPVMIKSPEDLSDSAGYDFVKDAINGLETALADSSFPDSGYRDLVDMDSFVDFLMVNEIVMNNEIGWPKSTYMYQDVGAKISMGPLWDFDWGFSFSGTGHQYFTSTSGLIWKHPFLARFFDDPEFVARYKARWASMHEQIETLPLFVAELASRLQRSQEQNFIRWPEAQNNGFDQEVADLSDWLQDRVAYLDEVIPAL
ncbi:MAG: CotH kinase family protein [Steroidobacteraceae bacterium]